MTKLLTLLLFCSFYGYSQQDSKSEKKEGKSTNIFTNTGDAAKMAVGKQKLYANEFVSALNVFKEVEKNNLDNSAVKHYMGLCYYNMGQMPNARSNFEKAVELNKNVNAETHFFLAKIYQNEGMFDEAITQLTLHKNASGAEKESLEEGAMLLNQCNNAKTLIQQPVDAKISNLGATINSKWDDKNPCITADGATLVFTTRRPMTTNSPVDVEGDGKYFEDIYVATLDSNSRSFVDAKGVAGAINTKGHDACTGISADGKMIFIYYSNMGKKSMRGGSVFVSKVNMGKWRKPVSLEKPINSSYWEGGACVSPDGKTYFFSSERPGGYGKSDIWMVKKKSKTEWSEPENLGPEINTAYDEGGMFLAPDGKNLFYCSNGPASMGSYDILRSTFENGKWSTPLNLGYPINTPSKEGQITLSADARFAYISSSRPGGIGESDLYKIDLENYAILEKDPRKKTGNGLSILKGTIRDGFEGYGIADVEVILNDASGNQVFSTSTNEIGEYFFTLMGGNYNLMIRKKGFEEINEPVKLEISTKETVILEKGYLLKKQG